MCSVLSLRVSVLSNTFAGITLRVSAKDPGRFVKVYDSDLCYCPTYLT